MIAGPSEVVIVAEAGAERESAIRLGRIGFDQVLGYLDGGLARVETRPDLIWTTERVSPEVAAARLASSSPPAIVDVRTANERSQKRIPGSIHVPLNHLTERLHEIPDDRPVLVHCAGGYRSSIAASLLQRSGRRQVGEIAGGIAAWEAARLTLSN
jgi:rhodanese-related sulfurtransferase